MPNTSHDGNLETEHESPSGDPVPGDGPEFPEGPDSTGLDGSPQYHSPDDDPKPAPPPPDEAPRPSTRQLEVEAQRRLNAYLRARQRAMESGDTGPDAPAPPAPSTPMRRPVAVTVYVSEEERYPEIRQALGAMLDENGFEIVDSLPPVRGSIFQTLIARTKDVLTSSGLVTRARKVERGVELHLLHKQQAEIDAMQGDAVAKLLTALASTQNALIQIGSVLVVKVVGVPVVRNLTQQELIHLERNPTLLRQPEEILEALQRVVAPPTAALVEQES